MEAASNGPAFVYDQISQQLRMQTDRPTAVRQAIDACRKGGTVFVLGVFGGVVDKFPLGAIMNRGLTLRSAQVHAPRYIPMLLERMAKGEIKDLSLRHPRPPPREQPARLRPVQEQGKRLPPCRLLTRREEPQLTLGAG